LQKFVSEKMTHEGEVRTFAMIPFLSRRRST